MHFSHCCFLSVSSFLSLSPQRYPWRLTCGLLLSRCSFARWLLTLSCLKITSWHGRLTDHGLARVIHDLVSCVSPFSPRDALHTHMMQLLNQQQHDRATIVQKKDLFFANILAFNADSYYSSSWTSLLILTIFSFISLSPPTLLFLLITLLSGSHINHILVLHLNSFSNIFLSSYSPVRYLIIAPPSGTWNGRT